MVTFLAPNGPIEIRMNDLPYDIVNGAKALGARYVVMVDHVREHGFVTVWGVFDMKKAQKNNPTPGANTIPLPSKTFESDSPDGAVMWALAQGSV